MCKNQQGCSGGCVYLALVVLMAVLVDIISKSTTFCALSPAGCVLTGTIWCGARTSHLAIGCLRRALLAAEPQRHGWLECLELLLLQHLDTASTERKKLSHSARRLPTLLCLSSHGIGRKHSYQMRKHTTAAHRGRVNVGICYQPRTTLPVVRTAPCLLTLAFQ